MATRQELIYAIRALIGQVLELDLGNCPVCGTNDGYLNLSRTHVFYCADHRVAWIVGTNLFNSWRQETEADWQRNEAKLSNFKKIDRDDACTPDQRKVWLLRHNAIRERKPKAAPAPTSQSTTTDPPDDLNEIPF
jgi:hypothetical protein